MSETQIDVSVRKSDLLLFGYWIAAAVAARLIYTTTEIALADVVRGTFAFALISALLRAGTQWLALQDEFAFRGQWFGATLVGVLLNGIVIAAASDAITQVIAQANPQSLAVAIVLFAGIQAVQGAFVGFFQYLVLRLEARRAGWWIAIMALANAVSTAVFIGMSANGFAPSNPYVAPVIVTFVNAVVSGAGLVWLLSERWDEDDLEDAGDDALMEATAE